MFALGLILGDFGLGGVSVLSPASELKRCHSLDCQSLDLS